MKNLQNVTNKLENVGKKTLHYVFIYFLKVEVDKVTKYKLSF